MGINGQTEGKHEVRGKASTVGEAGILRVARECGHDAARGDLPDGMILRDEQIAERVADGDARVCEACVQGRAVREAGRGDRAGIGRHRGRRGGETTNRIRRHVSDKDSATDAVEGETERFRKRGVVPDSVAIFVGDRLAGDRGHRALWCDAAKGAGVIVDRKEVTGRIDDDADQSPKAGRAPDSIFDARSVHCARDCADRPVRRDLANDIGEGVDNE